MKTIPRLLSAPSPGADQEAHDLFTSEGAPPELPRLLACPTPSEGPQRYRLPLWRLFRKPK